MLIEKGAKINDDVAFKCLLGMKLKDFMDDNNNKHILSEMRSTNISFTDN